jgi:pimeloyl-ACP methyl ester carboxylesterase
MLLAVPHPTSFVEVRGHRLEHVDIPSQTPDRPEILLLHEGLGSVSLWRDFPAKLAQRTGCRTIAYSRAGFGRSSPRTAPFTKAFMHEEALEILPALREALAIRRPMLVGHSTGASMALIHASHFPSPVVAMAPFAFVETSNVEAIRSNAAREDLRQRLARHHDDLDTIFFGWRDLWTDPGFAGWSIEGDLKQLRSPVLAMVGDRDEYCTPAQLDRIAEKARHARVEKMILADCGHAPHREHPATVLDAIERFQAETP